MTSVNILPQLHSPNNLSLFYIHTKMALTLPYTYFQCPCTDNSVSIRRVGDESPTKNGEYEDERTFDPRAPRSNYSLYPLEHLLYCEDCDQIRCPRCVLDEIVTWYCPNCLFEVPSSTVKSEGNRWALFWYIKGVY